MEISVEADRTTLSDSLLYTGIFPSPGGVSVCRHTDGVVHLFGEYAVFLLCMRYWKREIQEYFRGRRMRSISYLVSP